MPFRPSKGVKDILHIELRDLFIMIFASIQTTFGVSVRGVLSMIVLASKSNIFKGHTDDYFYDR